jgi:hypothetical protein
MQTLLCKYISRYMHLTSTKIPPIDSSFQGLSIDVYFVRIEHNENEYSLYKHSKHCLYVDKLWKYIHLFQLIIYSKLHWYVGSQTGQITSFTAFLISCIVFIVSSWFFRRKFCENWPKINDLKHDFLRPVLTTRASFTGKLIVLPFNQNAWIFQKYSHIHRL